MSVRRTSTDQRILRHNRTAHIWLTLAVAAGFFAAACVVAQAYVLSDDVDRVFQKKQTLHDVMSSLAVLLALAVLRAAIIWSSDAMKCRIRWREILYAVASGGNARVELK